VNGPLRFADEYVRHKVLDLIGDLALAGRRIEGHVAAERAGHAMHAALVSRLLKDRSAWELAHVPVETQAAEETNPVAQSGYSLPTPALIGHKTGIRVKIRTFVHIFLNPCKSRLFSGAGMSCKASIHTQLPSTSGTILEVPI